MGRPRQSSFVVLVASAICGAGQPWTLGPYAKGRTGVVVSGSTDSAAAGLEMLRRGGNAIDAAVATLLAESVANSEKFCFGGEVAILIYDARRAAVEAVRGMEVAPLLATVEHFEKAGGIRGGTVQSAAVPARAVAGS